MSLSPAVANRVRLDAALAPMPRVALGTWPTPLVPLRRLGDALGVDLWMKRDDASGLALGGNKARKLEFVFGELCAAGVKAVVTTGPVSSNHTMMTAAAARRLGLRATIVLGGRMPSPETGNLALTRLFGADIHVTPLDPASPSEDDLARSRALCERLVQERGATWIPPGATMPASVPGYAAAIREILDDCEGTFPFDDVIVAYGTGSTAAGLLAGLALADISATVHAVSVTSATALEAFGAASPVALAQAAVERYAWPVDLARSPTRLVWDIPADEPGYGIQTHASRAALEAFARDEGYLLDPTYTAKAAAALMRMARDGRLPRGRRVLFIHTGGLSTTASAPVPDRVP